MNLSRIPAVAAVAFLLAGTAHAVETRWQNDTNADLHRLRNLPTPPAGGDAIRLQDVAVGTGYIKGAGVNTLPLTASATIPGADVTITATQVGFGSVTNGLTSSARLVHDDSTTTRLTIGDGSTSTTARIALNNTGTGSNALLFLSGGTQYGSWFAQRDGAATTGLVQSGIIITPVSGGSLNDRWSVASNVSPAGSLVVYPEITRGDVALGGPNGGDEMATTDTRGFVWLPRMSGAPTQVPALDGVTSGPRARQAMTIDRLNNRLYYYDSLEAAWHYTAFDDGLSGSSSLTAGRVGYGSAGNLLTGDSTFKWDTTNQVLNVGTATTIFAANDVFNSVRSLNSTSLNLTGINPNTGALAASSTNLVTGSLDGTVGSAWYTQLNGPSYVTSGVFRANSSVTVLQRATGPSDTTMAWLIPSTTSGADFVWATGLSGGGVVRMRILNGGDVQIPDLSAGGHVSASAPNGELTVSATIPFADVVAVAPVAATYITQTANATLTNEQALGALASGMLSSVTTTGVVSSFAVGSARIPFGSGTNGVLTDDADMTYVSDALTMANSNGGNVSMALTKAGTQVIEKQGTGALWVGTAGSQTLNLHTAGVSRFTIDSAGVVSVPWLTAGGYVTASAGPGSLGVVTTIPGSGVSLTATQIGYGSVGNTITSEAALAYIAGTNTLTVDGTIQQKFPVGNVKAFGALGDGATDDTTAVQAALNASTNVYFPAGTYVISNVTVTTDGTRIFGDGVLSVLLMKAGAVNAMVTSTNQRITIENLALDGGIASTMKATCTPPANRSGIFINLENDVRLLNLTIHGFGTDALAHLGGGGTRASNAVIQNVTAYNNWLGIGLDGNGAEYVRVSNVDIHNNCYGVSIKAGNITVSNSKINDNAYGVYLYGTGNGNNGHGNVTGSLINHNTTNFFCEDVTIGYNVIANNMFEGPVSLKNCTGIHIEGGILDVTDYYFDGGGINYIRNNYIQNGWPNTLHHNFNAHADSTLMIDNFTPGGTFIDNNRNLFAAATVAAGSLTYGSGASNGNQLASSANLTYSGGVLSVVGLGTPGGYVKAATTTGATSSVASIPASDVTGLFYQTIQNAGSGLTQRTRWNASTGLTAVDNGGSTRTDVTANLSTGISGGQTAIGGTGASENLTLSSTSSGTKGKTIFGSTTGMQFDETGNVLSIGIASPAATTIGHLKRNTNTGVNLLLENNSAGNAAYVGITYGTSDTIFSGPYFGTWLYGTGFTTAGQVTAGTGQFQISGGTGNMLFDITQTSGDWFWRGTGSNTVRMQLTNAGVLSIANQAGTGTRLALLTSAGVVTNEAGLLVNESANLLEIAPGYAQGWFNSGTSTGGSFQEVAAFWSSNVFNLASLASGMSVPDMKITAGTAALHLNGGNVYVDNLTTNGYVKTGGGTGHLDVVTHAPGMGMKFSIWAQGTSSWGMRESFKDIYTPADTGMMAQTTNFDTVSAGGGSVGANLAAAWGTSATPEAYVMASDWAACDWHIDVPYFVATGTGSADVKVHLFKTSNPTSSGTYADIGGLSFSTTATGGGSSSGNSGTCSVGVGTGDRFLVAIYRSDSNASLAVTPIDVRVNVEFYK